MRQHIRKRFRYFWYWTKILFEYKITQFTTRLKNYGYHIANSAIDHSGMLAIGWGNVSSQILIFGIFLAIPIILFVLPMFFKVVEKCEDVNPHFLRIRFWRGRSAWDHSVLAQFFRALIHANSKHYAFSQICNASKGCVVDKLFQLRLFFRDSHDDFTSTIDQNPLNKSFELEHVFCLFTSNTPFHIIYMNKEN